MSIRMVRTGLCLDARTVPLIFLCTVVALGAVFACFMPGRALAAPPEVPYLEARVQSGELPPVSERLPQNPLVTVLDKPYQSPGAYGGDLNMLMAKNNDIRMMTVYGYARLVGYNDQLELVPDILESIEIEDNRVFTLKLRPGHKWSDGHPFTTEDFRYYWEDVASNPDLSPFGPPRNLMVGGKPPKFELIDDITLRYTWESPNPYFVPALAQPSPLFIYRPAHYLRQFHANYVDPDTLQKLVDESGSRNWAGLHHKQDSQYKLDVPALPTLQPWLNTVEPPSDRFVFVRNPFFHRVDPEGRQLPYIDRVLIHIVTSELVPAKAGSGETDLQARYLRFDNFPFLKAGEQNRDYRVRMWHRVNGSQVALYPNLHSSDLVWRELVRDVRMRRALSMGIDRTEINAVIYNGLATEGNNTVLSRSPLFKPEYQTSWAEHDPEAANKLLDEMGLTERDNRGIRLRPDGKPLEIVVHSAGESTEETDILELIHDNWLEIGVKLYTKPSQREVFRNRVFSGTAMMSVWSGIENAVPGPNSSPHEFTPTAQDQLQWPSWGQYYEAAGQAGSAPDMAPAVRLAELNEQWRIAGTEEERRKVWDEILEIHTDQVFTIGIVNGTFQPVVINNHLKNVPPEGIYSWEPSAYFGIYHPDTFYFDETRRG